MNIENIKNGYDTIARKYAKSLFDELDNKPLDRHLLKEFVKIIRPTSKVCDFGCGPGHVSRFLKDIDVDVFGADLSEGMITVASELNPDIMFEVDNMLESKQGNGSIGGVVLFYSVVHFELKEIEQVIKEMWRILEEEGILFLAFHEGDSIFHVDELFDEKVELDYVFLKTDSIVDALKGCGFKIIEALTRYPYEGYEYASKRGYIICKKTSV
jgi:SAM-dependent methyltransferase